MKRKVIMTSLQNENFEKWLAQFRKGYLELCVLVSINKTKSTYGFELIQVLEKAGLPVNEGTLYPLLNRMQKNELLESEWQPPADGGHPRRFYSLSENGKNLLPMMLTNYEKSHKTLEALS
jgi:PadR family transcriptional regulator PadR